MTTNPSQPVLEPESTAKCPWCSAESYVKEWDQTSYAECLTRETRRAFRSLSKRTSKEFGNKHFYKCPKCGQWSRGSKLRIKTNSGVIEADPFIEVG